MADVYILYSKRADKYYIGSCDDLSVRLKQHVEKIFANSFTTKWSDWELFFAIKNLEYEQARNIEQHIKKMKTRTYYSNLKKYPEMGLRLVEKYK